MQRPSRSRRLLPGSQRSSASGSRGAGCSPRRRDVRSGGLVRDCHLQILGLSARKDGPLGLLTRSLSDRTMSPSAATSIRGHVHSEGRRTSMRKLAPVLAALIVLAVPVTASAKVSLVGVTSPAQPGSYATLTAKVSKNVTCSIAVYYKSGRSVAQGLYPKRASGHRVSWTWMVGTRTTPGRWAIVVSCGSAGTLQTSFRVS